VGVYEKVETK